MSLVLLYSLLIYRYDGDRAAYGPNISKSQTPLLGGFYLVQKRQYWRSLRFCKFRNYFGSGIFFLLLLQLNTKWASGFCLEHIVEKSLILFFSHVGKKKQRISLHPKKNDSESCLVFHLE